MDEIQEKNETAFVWGGRVRILPIFKPLKGRNWTRAQGRCPNELSPSLSLLLLQLLASISLGFAHGVSVRPYSNHHCH